MLISFTLRLHIYISTYISIYVWKNQNGKKEEISSNEPETCKVEPSIEQDWRHQSDGNNYLGCTYSAPKVSYAEPDDIQKLA